MAKPAASAEDVEVKPKKPIVKIILALVGLVLLIAGTMVGTLFIAGFFSKPPPNPDQAMVEETGHDKPAADTHGGKKPEAGHGGKVTAEMPKLNKKSPDSPRFEYTYHQLVREFLVNLVGSRKVMSVQIAIMTRYDDRVVENVKKHEFALRSVVMDVMRQTSEADLSKPDFRKNLAIRIRDAMNSLIEKYEDFGGIEDVYFTTFIVQ
ncbi:MAG: flagellar basal body-associated FliL family protein [Burkholderiaceae bacterium]